jgi:NADPH-dependent 2,4-dienoyl-CoA reductase/sulfur reductase-like enzyme
MQVVPNSLHWFELSMSTHYVIVGNGVAGIRAAFEIRKRYGPDEAEITVIGEETDYFFSRTALMYAYMNEMQRPDLEPYEREAYERQAIERVRGRVVDIDAESRELTLEPAEDALLREEESHGIWADLADSIRGWASVLSGGDDAPRTGSGRVASVSMTPEMATKSSDDEPPETLEYDKLLLAVGSQPRHIPFEGLAETDEGVVNFVSMQDLEQCERLTPSTDRAVVVGGGLIGIELVECLHHHGVEVTFLVREPYFWPAGLHQREGEIIVDHIREHDGIDLRLKEELAEVVPGDDGRVEAVQTSEDDRIPCQMLGIAIGVVPNVDWLESVETPPATDHGILVDRSFETSLPDVWAAGDCVEVETEPDENNIVEHIWYSAKRHGTLAGRSMLGDDVDYEPPLFYNSAKFLKIEYTTVGEVTTAEPGTPSIYRKMPGEPISQRIVYDEDGEVIGFNMLGSRWDHETLETWIEQHRDVDWVLDHLEEAQFDVEFGRVDLDEMSEERVELHGPPEF